MAFTVTFRSSGPGTTLEELSEWLTERGEPFAAQGDHTLALRALPVRFVATPDAALKAQLEITATIPLTRLVDMLFEMSMRLGADVHLAGFGAANRPGLWLRLADEQDRMRIAAALKVAREHGNADEVHKRLWAVVACTRPGRDDRWDAASERVMELLEIGEGIPLEEAAFHTENAQIGETIAVPVVGCSHVLVWRWLSEAYPGLIESAR